MTVCSSSLLQRNTRQSSRVVHRACAWRDGDLPDVLGYAAAPALGDCAANLQHWQGYGCLHVVTMHLQSRSLFRGLDRIMHTGFLDYLSSQAAHEGLCHWQYPCEWVCVSAWLAISDWSCFMNMVMFHKGIAGVPLLALHQQHERTVKELALYMTCRWGASCTSFSKAIMQIVYHGSKAVYGQRVID